MKDFSGFFNLLDKFLILYKLASYYEVLPKIYLIVIIHICDCCLKILHKAVTKDESSMFGCVALSLEHF